MDTHKAQQAAQVINADIKTSLHNQTIASENQLLKRRAEEAEITSEQKKLKEYSSPTKNGGDLSSPVSVDVVMIDEIVAHPSLTSSNLPITSAAPLVAPPAVTPLTYVHPHPVSVTNYGNFADPEDDELNRTQLKFAGTLIKSLKRAKEAYLFSTPVDPVKLNIPQYHDVIKRPMDFSTVQRKFDSMGYLSFRAFHADIELIFDNCFTFNGTDSFISKQCLSLQTYYHKQVDKLPTETKQTKKKSLDFSSLADLARPKRPVSQSYSQAPLSPAKGRKNHTELKFCLSALRELQNKKHQALNYVFAMPVDAVAMGIPQYFDIISQPMDLSTIKRKMDAGEYCGYGDYEDDVRLMFNNCYTFNQPHDEVYLLGKRLEQVFDEKWATRPTATAGSYQRKGDASSDEEDENQQIAMLQQNLARMSSELALLMDKRRKRKDRLKADGYHIPTSAPSTNTLHTLPMRKPKTRKHTHIPEITFDMKKEISEKINLLAQDQIVHVFQIIREGLPGLGSIEEEEIELDIDSLDAKTLYRLFKYVKTYAGGDAAASTKFAGATSDSEGGSESD